MFFTQRIFSGFFERLMFTCFYKIDESGRNIGSNYKYNSTTPKVQSKSRFVFLFKIAKIKASYLKQTSQNAFTLVFNNFLKKYYVLNSIYNLRFDLLQQNIFHAP
ncbi:hypothetical protein H312_02741 [Anncaliia algerae PRA339]|uniref:Uncharacterized protein n=1 Tax=Anncaliia algerae PRA339 TaxID=1288291 RepID=A0A059EY71_9MICR|nr:hypothetical protein H312_02741 [Anncaliia algerae PRA339]